MSKTNDNIILYIFIHVYKWVYTHINVNFHTLTHTKSTLYIKEFTHTCEGILTQNVYYKHDQENIFKCICIQYMLLKKHRSFLITRLSHNLRWLSRNMYFVKTNNLRLQNMTFIIAFNFLYVYVYMIDDYSDS